MERVGYCTRDKGQKNRDLRGHFSWFSMMEVLKIQRGLEGREAALSPPGETI